MWPLGIYYYKQLVSVNNYPPEGDSLRFNIVLSADRSVDQEVAALRGSKKGADKVSKGGLPLCSGRGTIQMNELARPWSNKQEREVSQASDRRLPESSSDEDEPRPSYKKLGKPGPNSLTDKKTRKQKQDEEENAVAHMGYHMGWGY